MYAQGYERVEFEIIGTSNPLQINLNNVGTILGIELEQFDWAPAISSLPSNYIGMSINGLKGRYNQFGNGINTLRTIPYNPTTSKFSFEASQDDDMIGLGSSNCELTISFVYRFADQTTGLNPKFVTFDNNYLLNFSLTVQKR